MRLWSGSWQEDYCSSPDGASEIATAHKRYIPTLFYPSSSTFITLFNVMANDFLSYMIQNSLSQRITTKQELLVPSINLQRCTFVQALSYALQYAAWRLNIYINRLSWTCYLFTSRRRRLNSDDTKYILYTWQYAQQYVDY